MRDQLAMFGALFVIASVFTFPAVAQEPDTVVSLAPIFDGVVSYIVAVFSAGVLAILSFAANLIRKWVGEAAADKARKTLHSAAVTGLTTALQHFGKPIRELSFDARSVIIREAIEWVTGPGARQAVIRHNLTPKDVERLILSKFRLLETAENSFSGDVLGHLEEFTDADQGKLL